MKNLSANKPNMILIELTSKCNLKCDYCFKSRIKYPVKEIRQDTFLRIRDNIAGIGIVTLCGMGEQFLHPGIYDFVRMLKDKEISIQTNGMIPIDYERLLRFDNISWLGFSLDGPNEEIMRRTCSRYSFARLSANLEKSLEYGRLKKSISYVLGPENLRHTPGIFDLLEKYRFQLINLLLPTYNAKWIKANLEEIESVVFCLLEKSISTGIEVLDPFTAKCGCGDAPVAAVDTGGIYRPCCDPSLRDFPIGNISSLSFAQIWNSKAYDDFKTGQHCRTCVYTMFEKFKTRLTPPHRKKREMKQIYAREVI